MNVKIDDIKIINRSRLDFGNLQDLMKSIETKGLLYPIIIQRDYTLVDGERRFKACKELGWTDIPAIIKEDLPEIDRKLLEYETNSKRKDFTWQEEASIIYEIHITKLKEDPTWNTTKTAELVGMSQPSISIIMQLVDSIKKYPEIITVKNKIDAFNKSKSFEKMDILKQIHSLSDKNNISLSYTIIKGDALIELKSLESNSIDAIITDPPYGIDINDSALTDSVELYKDDKTYIFSMLDEVIAEYYRLLKSDASGWIWYHIAYHTDIIALLQKHKFNIYPIPLIWYKSSSPSAKVLRHTYESCLLFTKKSACSTITTPASVQQFSSLYKDDKFHTLEKPFELLKVLIESISVEGDTILDSFCGAGSIPVASLKLLRKIIGIEQNEAFAELASIRCKEIEDSIINKGE